MDLGPKKHTSRIEVTRSTPGRGESVRSFIGTSDRRCSRSPLGDQLTTTLVVTISAVLFFFCLFSPPLRPFLIVGVL